LKGRIHIQILKLFFLTLAFISCERNFSPFEPELLRDYSLVYNKQDKNCRWQIILNNIRGTNPQDISNNPYNDAYDPVWSPTGEYIAFRWDKGIGGSDVYLYDMNGDNLINITNDLAMNESASPEMWTPDGKKLLYHYHKMGEPSYYYIMNSDGTEKQKLFETEAGSIIAFCDQGNSILYTQNQCLYKKNITTNSTELILNLKDVSVYSTWVDDYDPVSNTILCHEDSSSWDGGATFLIKKINLDMMETDTLVVAENQIKLLRPVFSNDYQKVAYIALDYKNSISKLILLENNKKKVLNSVSNEKSYWIDKIEFSPYDSYITYTVSENIPGDWVGFKRYVYVLNIATKNARLIDEGNDPHWNPLINF